MRARCIAVIGHLWGCYRCCADYAARNRNGDGSMLGNTAWQSPPDRFSTATGTVPSWS